MKIPQHPKLRSENFSFRRNSHPRLLAAGFSFSEIGIYRIFC